MPHPEPPTQEQAGDGGGLRGLISAAGAVIVVVLGLAFVFVIALVSLGTLPGDQKSTVITAAFGVIGTIVGTYFGVRAGAAGKDRAEAARDLEAIKVQELAAQVDAPTAQAALDRAEQRAEVARSASQTNVPAL